MSHFTKIEVKIDSIKALEEALEQMGYESITGRHTMKNDFSQSREVDLEVKELPVGFTRNDEGEFEMEADWWGTGINGDDFAEELTQLHSKYKTLDSLKQDGWKVKSEETMEDGRIKLKVSRWSS
jgi:hypothetical protein